MIDDEIKDFKENGGYDSWTSFHGYHVRNYYATNKHFGTLNEFKELRDKLHENNLKLVIDFVTNHTSRGHNPTKNNENEDGKLYEPDKLPNGTYAIDNDGNPYDYNKDGKLENLIADPNNDKDGWFHHFGDRGNDESKWAYRNKELGSLSDFSQENSQVVNYLEKAVNYWTTFGIDGLRHDATLHMSPSFVKGLKDSISSNVKFRILVNFL
ncbi:alpha-amylase family glycosyl hydrolase [Streptococcus parauberis]|uniref:alpha-amylase family glycosyl hydrolase n=1 Tax=Streptococcus parauberis TaxID=1348 RepID=UPI000CCF58A2|nr:alpha-amylase family glycosyl hydrolase [Streptococcus parauberis]PNY18594.1 Cyclomaltodextrin glucanotransferase precursor [Streptococcus parauberis]